ncbi:Hypothetical protein D9617_41g062540 [Elsinoe fawcettii]|nr:Hypothetical protein D9617_41g062540 [Elsinoe fawcettii]
MPLEMGGVTNHKIIVAIDFGTTSSGIAFVYAPTGKDVDRIHVVKSWSGGQGGTSDKVPSTLEYDVCTGAVKWGFEVGALDNPLRCFKLLLDKDKGLPSWVNKRSVLATLEKMHKTPIDVTADYLRQLYALTQLELKKKYSADLLDHTPIEYIVTIPAVWSESAKQATAVAARNAGIAKPRLISEPEAAAIETLTAMQEEAVNTGDIYVVCDAGGGTVDLISYEVTSTQPLRFHEVVPGDGDFCGSVFLDTGFADLVAWMIGKDDFARLQRDYPKAWARALHAWETEIKPGFVPKLINDEEDELDDIEVPFNGIPDGEFSGIDLSFLTISNHDVAEIFDPVMQRILNLIQAQLRGVVNAGKTPTGILLVGGLG